MSLLGENHKRGGQFYVWLRYQREREDVIGDLARYVFWDREAPKQSSNPEVWRYYCRRKAYPFMVNGFEIAWRVYNRIHGEVVP